MIMENREKLTDRVVNWMRYSISLRLIVIGILTLILLIPLAFIQDLINERQFRQESVVNEVNEKWGEQVIIYGPVLAIPYRTFTQVYQTDPKTQETVMNREEKISQIYIFPEELDVVGKIDTHIKKRGLYNTVVYNSKNTINGYFELPDLESKDIVLENIIWEKAKVIIQTSNLKGINNDVKININDNLYSFLPKYSKRKTRMDDYSNNLVVMHSLESKMIKLQGMDDLKKLEYSLNIDLNGSQQMSFIPVGRKTNVQLTSSWKSPSFIGNFLPYNEDKLKEEGFDAKWSVLNINRGFEQLYEREIPSLTEYAFGVKLMLPVDQYQQSMRSAKYGFLVIALTFLLFFLIQSISKIHIHPFQYLMIGIALTIFYTLLIAISEHTNFIISYLISAIAVVGLITLYTKSILKNVRFTSLIGLSLSLLYAFIFVIIQLENYALIVGSIGLFIILALVMYASRKIDWEIHK